MTFFTRIGRAVLDALQPRPTPPSRRTRSTRTTGVETPAVDGSDYPGDFTGRTALNYDPHPGNTADPGEVVWTWVPFEEDHSQGKDRPVLVIGRDGPWLLALPMTSKDHDRDAGQEAGEGRYWFDIGSGSWDAQGRESEVRVNRIIRVDPARVRRIAARVRPAVFDGVAAAVRSHW
ncbi:MAG: type II toxin-antitoxin system PemK/MazF family toxin [Propionicimonas sp.]|uniref:type II toxin-antitoxin system PemK/MazF family toxin n=1 Tax=Propionicimonas sp. TaxID=1955623 RepID=UPI003D0AEB6A